MSLKQQETNTHTHLPTPTQPPTTPTPTPEGHFVSQDQGPIVMSSLLPKCRWSKDCAHQT